ncbi:putative F-box domain, FBD domain, leucine-rich repeat domain superfamily [Helianthus annuus]|uniref:F-box domain, FBD domain, leucine-rich repeat domain superfamily n=1 Tax=Helianthus annuus TaxID=4232 RepID=A0A9K3DWW9_HELAN|nr:putative F-box domain, FBD domain, leucine-rich repeat domain superfamily [Helianthus annuus]KAJ0823165.1 putative F-box domain, FBD domain, leucine-rich repeat domain superfamily [Helianthus annuus]
MELIQGIYKASEFAPQDFISNMPDNVVTNILDRLPVQLALRTSILSRNWRFKWTMLTQLVFDDNFFEYLTKTSAENNHGGIISRLLLNVKGGIEKFVFFMPKVIDNNDVENINHWILFLSRKRIKDITLTNTNVFFPLKLPTYFFSCLELKHLKLTRCCELGEILTRCPSLEILDMRFFFYACKVKLVDIVKAKNLKMLSLSVCNIDAVAISSSTIFELVGFLPKLQDLDLDFLDYTVKDAHPWPNPIPEVEYKTTGLRSVVFTYFAGSENEVCLIKYILACSPILEKIVIHPHWSLASDGRLMFTRKLLKLRRASTVAEIDFD